MPKLCLKTKLDATVKKEATLLNKDTSSLVETNPNAAGRRKIENFDLDALKKPSW